MAQPNYGLAGMLQMRQANQQADQAQLAGLARLLAMKQAQEEQPLRMDLLRGQIADREGLARFRDAQIADMQRKSLLSAQQQQALGGLAQLLGRPFQGVEGQGAPEPSGVMMNEDAALRAAIEADKRGEQVRMDVPNPGLVQGLAVLADPQRAIPEILKQQRPEKPASPLADAKAVAGGYIVPNPQGGSPIFTRTARDPTEGPMSPIGRLNRDLKAGDITQAQFDQELSRKNKGSLTGITPENANMTGREFIATLDPAMARNVEALINYEAPLTTFSQRTGERAALLAAAKQADPKFNAMKYPVRQQVMADFTKGPTANNIVALDQAINHMGTMYDLGTALQNNDVRAVNTAVNFLRDQTGDPRVNNFNTAKQAVGEELMRVFRQVNASEQEALDWQRKFSAANSPAQIKGALQTATTLLEGRVNAINNRWNRAFDTTSGYPNLFSPEAINVFKKIGLTMKAPQVESAFPQRRATDRPGAVLRFDAQGNLIQ